MTAAEYLACDRLRWAVWLHMWRLIGLWENHPPHVRALVGLSCKERANTNEARGYE